MFFFDTFLSAILGKRCAFTFDKIIIFVFFIAPYSASPGALAPKLLYAVHSFLWTRFAKKGMDRVRFKLMATTSNLWPPLCSHSLCCAGAFSVLASCPRCPLLPGSLDAYAILCMLNPPSLHDRSLRSIRSHFSASKEMDTGRLGGGFVEFCDRHHLVRICWILRSASFGEDLLNFAIEIIC